MHKSVVKSSTLKNIILDAVVVLSFAAVGIWAFFPVIVHGMNNTLQLGSNGDSALQVWFLAAPFELLLKGHNPFITNYINYPHGADLLQNTSMPALGLLLFPILKLWGPIAEINVGYIMAISLNGIAMYFVLKAILKKRLPAYVGGLLFSINPYSVGQAQGHLNLMFLPIFPVLIYLIYAFIKDEHRNFRTVAIFAVLFSIQYYISSELLVDFVFVLGVTLLVLILCNLKFVKLNLKPILSAICVAVIIVFVLVLPGVALGYESSLSYSGPPQPAEVLHNMSYDVLTPILPNANQLVNFGHAAKGSNLVYTTYQNKKYYSSSENGGYIGIFLILVVLIALFSRNFKSFKRYVALFGILAFAISLGPYLKINGHTTSIPLLYYLLAKLPFMGYGLPTRYALCFWMSCAFLISLYVYDLQEIHWTKYSSLVHKKFRLIKLSEILGMVVLVLMAFVLLLPNWPHSLEKSTLPMTPFRDMTVFDGSPAITYPLALGYNNEGMLFQVASDMSFKLVGGYLIVRSPNGTATFQTGTPTIDALTTGCLNFGSIRQTLKDDPSFASRITALPKPTSRAVIDKIGGELLSDSMKNNRIDFAIIDLNFIHADCGVRLFENAGFIPFKKTQNYLFLKFNQRS